MTLDHSVTLPIRFTPYHICNIVFHIVPTLTPWYVAWNGVVFLIFTGCELDFASCDLNH